MRGFTKDSGSHQPALLAQALVGLGLGSPNWSLGFQPFAFPIHPALQPGLVKRGRVSAEKLGGLGSMPTSATNSIVILSKYLPFSGPQLFSEPILWTNIPMRCLMERQAFFPLESHQQRNLFHLLFPKPFLKHRTRQLQELPSSSKMLWSTLSSPPEPPQELAPPSSPLSQKPCYCSGFL